MPIEKSPKDLALLLVGGGKSERGLIRSRFQGVADRRFKIAEAQTEEELWKELKGSLYDLILIDGRTLPAEGFEILEKVCHKHLESAVILLVADKDKNRAEEALRKGAMDVETFEDFLKRDMAAFVHRVAERRFLPGEVSGWGELRQMKNEFIANISHEMRTPLSVIMGYIQILKEGALGPINEEQKKALETILGRSEDLLRILTHVLRAREIQEGKEKVRLLPLELRQYLVSKLEKPYRDKTRKKMALERSLPDREIWVRADSQRLSEVVDNLLLNAFKFGPESSTVRVVLEVSPTEVLLQVQDEGPGVSPEMRAKVFDPLSGTEQGLTRQWGGLGLGLYLCKEIMEHHGGRIWLESPEGGPGCAAGFALPLISTPPGQAAVPALKKIRILIVEDDLDFTQLLVIFLGRLKQGLEIISAESGEDALRLVKERSPHLIVLDLLMPGMDGFAVMEKLKKDPQTADIPVMVISGYDKGMDRATHAGAQEILMKPFDEATFIMKVNRLLHPKDAPKKGRS